MTIHRAANQPKRKCIRGHVIKDAGFSWQSTYGNGTKGVIYLTRRCNACRVEDVLRCRARAALKRGAR